MFTCAGCGVSGIGNRDGSCSCDDGDDGQSHITDGGDGSLRVDGIGVRRPLGVSGASVRVKGVFADDSESEACELSDIVTKVENAKF